MNENLKLMHLVVYIILHYLILFKEDVSTLTSRAQSNTSTLNPKIKIKM
jgi:hypothetical protein